MKQKGKNYWIQLVVIFLVLFVVLTYIVSLIAQLGATYMTSLGSSFIGEKIDFSGVKFGIGAYFYAFKNPLIFLVSAIITAASSGSITHIYSQFFRRGERDETREFTYAKSGAYGTARWGNVDEFKELNIANVTTVDKAEGSILGQLDKTGKKIINTSNKSRLNKHVAVFGASGTGKSRCYSRNQMIQAVKKRESVIVTDPKGELFEDTAKFFEKNGYNVKIFNLVNPEKSDSWNCLKEITNDLMAQVFADTVIKNTNTNGGKTDEFWDSSEMNLLKALILRVAKGEDFKKIDRQDMGAVYELLIKATGESGLDELFNPASLTPEERVCIPPYRIFKQAPENTRGSIILGLGTKLQVFQNDVIKKLTQYEDIDLTRPGKEPCAYFCIMSDQDSTLNFLSSLFFSFLFIDLVRYADSNGGRCDTDVNFILDEFPNIGQIVDFTKKISTVRSRGLNISVIFQAVSQLENRYPHGLWQEILGNCDTHLFLGCNDPNTAKFISERAGEVTIESKSKSVSRRTSISPLYKEGIKNSIGEGKRKLLTQDEVMRTPIDECIIIFRGQNALKAYKYDYSNHPKSKEFERCYIRDLPSIFDKEKILKEKKLKEKEETEIAKKLEIETVIKKELEDCETNEDEIILDGEIIQDNVILEGNFEFVEDIETCETISKKENSISFKDSEKKEGEKAKNIKTSTPFDNNSKMCDNNKKQETKSEKPNKSKQKSNIDNKLSEIFNIPEEKPVQNFQEKKPEKPQKVNEEKRENKILDFLNTEDAPTSNANKNPTKTDAVFDNIDKRWDAERSKEIIEKRKRDLFGDDEKGVSGPIKDASALKKKRN